MPSKNNSAWQTAVVMYWVFPPTVLVLLQYFGITINGNSIESQVQVSDAGAWMDCASSFPLGDTWKDGWCMRRPNAFLFLAPLAHTVGLGAGIPVFLQVVMLSGSLSYLALVLIQEGIPRRFVAIGLFLSTWIVLVHGVYMGPEALSIVFSALSLAFLMRALRDPRWGYVIAGPLLMCLAYTMRPGNPILTLAVCGLFVYSASQINSTRLAPFWSAIFGALPFFIPGIFRALGHKEAGHSANFASTIYALVDRDVTGWPQVYEIFSKERTGLDFESFAWREYVLSEAGHVFQSDPFPALSQGVKNLLRFFDIGFLNMTFSTGAPRVELLRLSSWLDLLHSPSALMILLVPLFLWAMSWFFIFKTLLRTVWADRQTWIRLHFLKEKRLPRLSKYDAYSILGVSTVVGALATFVVVGHDESIRHVVTNTPFLIFLFLSAKSLSISPIGSMVDPPANQSASPA